MGIGDVEIVMHNICEKTKDCPICLAKAKLDEMYFQNWDIEETKDWNKNE